MATNHHELERYSFLWSEARLIIAAIALFLGGIPPVYYFLRIPGMFLLERSLLTLCWIISGLAVAYLLYRWNTTKHVFGGKDQKDVIAFAVMAVSGLNLGFAGLTGSNIGMSIASGRGVFDVAGIIYLIVAYHLYTRWQKHGEKLF